MNHRPQSWEELRRTPADESTVDMPDELRELLNEEQHERSTVFLDRAAEDTGNAREGETLESYRPPWVATSILPRRARAAKPPTVRHHDQRLEPAIIYQPDERKTYNDRSYPWGCVCKITTAWGFVGSGVLIGPRHVLTASHCVEWATSEAEKIQVHLTGTTAAATAFATRAYAVTKISGGDPTLTTLDEDYACLVLDQRLGDVFGYLGVRQYDSAWDGDNVWSSMGYPGDIARGRQPTYILNKSMDEDEFDLGSGRAMTTSADMQKGQSGAPMFAWWDGAPYVVAVMSAYGQVWASGMENWCSGGADLLRVVRKARDENP